MDTIFDIDGTLADIQHRRHYVSVKPKNWPAFEKAIKFDTAIVPILNTALTFQASNHRLIFCSGRGEQQRAQTTEWLERHGLISPRIYMRAEKDYRSDDIIKEELLDRILADGFNPQLVFDDRDRVVAMWRRRGLICAQVAPGDF